MSQRSGQAIINYISDRFCRERPDLQGKGIEIDQAIVRELYNMSESEFQKALQFKENVK